MSDEQNKQDQPVQDPLDNFPSTRLFIGTADAIRQDLKPVLVRAKEIDVIQTNDDPRATRGTKYTLYLERDGTLFLYIEVWSKWAGEPDVSRIERASWADFNVGGKHEDLGFKMGYARPLTLQEAIQRCAQLHGPMPADF